jgi:hypothetical protein
MTQVPAARSFRPAKLPRWLLLALGAVFVFIAGLAIPYARAVRLDAQLERTERALTLARLENTVATAALEARRGRYESARQLASDFFTRLQGAGVDLPAEARDEMRAVLTHRDTTITLLSRGAATSTDLLEHLIAEYRGVLRAAAAARNGGDQDSARPRPAKGGG